MEEWINKDELVKWLELVDGCIADGTVTPQTLYAQIMRDIKQFRGVKGELLATSKGEILVKVDGDTVGTWDGIIYVVCGEKSRTIFVTAIGDDNDKFITLNDILKEIDCNTYDYPLVIIEDALSGNVYRYNNYGDNSWWKVGETKGYA